MIALHSASFLFFLAIEKKKGKPEQEADLNSRASNRGRRLGESFDCVRTDMYVMLALPFTNLFFVVVFAAAAAVGNRTTSRT